MPYPDMSGLLFRKWKKLAAEVANQACGGGSVGVRPERKRGGEKRSPHHHHQEESRPWRTSGGAWKVAYADFVTAMMALFIVLWLLNSSKQVQEAVGGYFKDPSGTSKKVGTNLVGSGENFSLSKDNMPKLKEELQKSIRQMSDFDKFKNQIEMTITSEGLRIELLETESGTFFNSGSPKPSDKGVEFLAMLAGELGKLPNKVSIEGHTDSKPYAARETMATGSSPPTAPMRPGV